MKLSAKNVLFPAAILLTICVLVSAALAGTNLLTKDKIAEQQALKAEESRKVVLPSAESFEEQDGGAFYRGLSGGETVGYVFETESKGYGGEIRVMTGIDAQGSVTGVVILSHGETPGLGANAEKAEFRDQFKQPIPDGDIQVVKYQTPQEGQIEAMTGATITSRAVTNAVNQALELYRENASGELPTETEGGSDEEE